MTEKGFSPRSYTDQEIVTRCMFPLVNEGAKILMEGVASRASNIDVIWTAGYGFPKYRGGPMFWADQIGLDTVLEGMKRLYDQVGEWCPPGSAARMPCQGKQKFLGLDPVSRPPINPGDHNG